ncbi:sister chromatid cohesion protein PDS5 homolog A-B-like isoform X3 [Gigantopelta aegis]|uniref:sister chromatid cohesion protein PDS5 homolog A-B-like isoform X3 n=1 Tax=Gigantopelta aegis TaxID=1735272 RepID=UPI001B888702|nr:sister chromatid cohesion protein PDS5 homolog A-B-like isoform X3 [Gigantopelta aegis]
MSKSIKVVYPPGCKDVNEELGKDELVKRLKLLARAFQDMGQDGNEQYSGLAIMLATDFYTDHPNKDVRLLVACCIADVFRIFAPEAPYKDADHLKEIFMFLTKQLRGLEDPDAPSFKRYFYLLENLSWVKSFNICLELDENQEIFVALFKLMLSIVSEKHSSKVKNFMLDMMTPLIAEADAVSQDLLDAVLINLVEPQKTQHKQAYALAKELLKRTSSAIEPYIQAFFNTTLMLGKTSESEVSNHLYELIYELNQVSPNVLLAVLPQLEFKLKSNEESERKHVTKLLAKMFSEPGSMLAVQNKPLWNCFLGRFNDISTSVRITCVSFSQHFFLNHPNLTKDILEQMKVRQHDPEDTVRMEVVNCVLNVAKKDFSVVNDDMMTFIKERTRDKKFRIRREALLGLGIMYKNVMSKTPVNPVEVEKVSWIKQKVFYAYYQTSNDDRLLVERILNIHLVPYVLEPTEKMKKLLQLFGSLDEKAVKAFKEMLKHRHGVRLCVMQLLEALEQSGPNSPPFLPRLAALARTLPESQKPQEYMKKFCQILKTDQRMRGLLKLIIGSECTCQKAETAVKEILKKIGCNVGHPNFLYNLVKSLLERVAPVMIDAVAIEKLVKHIDQVLNGQSNCLDGVENAGEKSVELLFSLSTCYPYYFRSAEVFEKLLTFLKHDDDAVCDITLQILTNTGGRIQSNHPNIYSSLVPLLVSTAKMGNPKQTKHAIQCVSQICRDKEPILSQIFEHVKKNLDIESANYITSIVAMGHIAMLCPDKFSAEMKSIVSKVIVKDLLMQDRTEGIPTEESWYANHMVSEETQAKVQAMKLLVRWLLGIRSNAQNSGTSTLRLLYTVIIHEGDLMEQGAINKPELARLRLQAGCSLLKLAEETCFAEIIGREQFQALALLINDTCYHVRLKFSHKLHKGLLSMKLPLEYMSIFSLAANDPLKERRVQLKQFLNVNVNKRREFLKQNPGARNKMTAILPDYVLPYSIHLLAHDPDLKSYDHTEALRNIKECLWFLMEPLIGKSEDYNYAFFQRMIESIKQTKDSQNPDDEETNKKLYAVCDVALGLLMAKATNVTLKDVNVEPVLPSKLFTKPDKSYSNTKSYLPKDFKFDGPKKKGIHALIDGAGKHSAEVIMVESPGPVINPSSRSPRVSRKQWEKQNQKKNDSDSDSQNESDKSQSSEEPKKVTRGTKKTKRGLAGAKQKAAAAASKKDSGTTSEESQQSEESEKSQTSVKAGTRQTKIEDFSAKSSSTKEKEQSKKSLVNGAAKSSVKLKRTTTTKSDTKSSDSNAKNASNSRKRQLSAEDSSRAAKQKRSSGSVETDSQKTITDDSPSKLSSQASSTRIARSVHLGLRESNVVKNLHSDLSETETSQDSMSSRLSPRKRQASSPSSPHSSPSSQDASSQPAFKKSLLTRAGVTKAHVGSGVESSSPALSRVTRSRDVTPSITESSQTSSQAGKGDNRKGTSKKEATKVLTKGKQTQPTKPNVRIVRKARTFTNGTSDGDETPETDSSMSPRRTAALTKAIQEATNVAKGSNVIC